MQYLFGNLCFFSLLFLCMSFHFLPRNGHEVFGVLILVPFLYHNWRFRSWWAALMRGKTLRNSLGRLIGLTNLLLLVLMVAVTISGVMISNFVFRDVVPLSWRMSITAHQIHKSLCFALWIVTGLHVGLHLEGWLRRQLRSSAVVKAWIAAVSVICGLGIYSSFLHQIGDRLLLKHIFATPALKGGMVVYIGGLLAIFGLYMIAGWLMHRFCNQRRDTAS